MADYKIAAIPTEYRGIRYRSRLEARWAAFFDCLGWGGYEYEPFRISGWLPDFRLPAQGLLVEVKPHDYWEVHPSETWGRISRASEASGRQEDLLLTRAAPDRIDGYPCLGWAGAGYDSYDRRHAYLVPTLDGGWYLAKEDRREFSRRAAPDWDLCNYALSLWHRAGQEIFS